MKSCLNKYMHENVFFFSLYLYGGWRWKNWWKVFLFTVSLFNLGRCSWVKFGRSISWDKSNKPNLSRTISRLFRLEVSAEPTSGVPYLIWKRKEQIRLLVLYKYFDRKKEHVTIRKLPNSYLSIRVSKKLHLCKTAKYQRNIGIS